MTKEQITAELKSALLSLAYCQNKYHTEQVEKRIKELKQMREGR